jgi:hypothetical protein
VTLAIKAVCHCGSVNIELAHAPTVVVECNCSLCRSYGVIWTYCDVADLAFSATPLATDTYAWNGKTVTFHRCSDCGCVTHWVPRSAQRTMRGVNARLLPSDVFAAARLRHKDGAGSGEFLD